MRLSFIAFLMSLALTASPSDAFQSIHNTRSKPTSALFMSSTNNNKRFSLHKVIQPLSLGLALALTGVVAPAQASAPVMAVPAQEMPDPEKLALDKVRQQLAAKDRAEVEAYNAKARKIEQQFGDKARDQFEKDYRTAKQEQATAKAEGLLQLQAQLLEQGICPFVDPEGYRQVFLYKNGKDLAEVPGTKYYGDYQFELRKDKRAFSVEKKANRDMVKLIVQDCKNKGLDVVQYFDENQDRTAQILDYPRIIAEKKLKDFLVNVEKYGQTTVPRPGEMSVLEEQAADPDRVARLEAEAAATLKDAEAQVKIDEQNKADDAKAAAKAEKERVKAQAKEEKEKLKAQAKAQKDELKAEKAARKAELDAVKAASTAAAVAGAKMASDAAAAAASIGSSAQSGVDVISVSDAVVEGSDTSIDTEGLQGEEVPSAVAVAETQSTSKGVRTKKFPIVPATAFLTAAGGGAFVISKSREKAAAAEEERQRQFKLIMGISENDAAVKKKKRREEASADFDLNLDDETSPAPPKSIAKAPIPATPAPAPEAVPEIPKKKKGGIRTMFAKKSGNSRESDLSALVATDARAPKLASLLAKLLSFGAPGRFPQVDRLAGPMPVEEFDLDEAKSLLVDACEDAGLSKEDGAEVFANVVNCMLIDIVDLASAALKEDAKVTFNAINVVIDFMNHAASLYDAVAEGIVITPVTYGGDLAKSKLEQMYGTYAFSGILEVEQPDMVDRIDLLRNVFAISEKKAEGIVMKATQKNMMEMMKNPEGMEELQKVMGGMMGGEGMEGLEGLLGGDNGEGPNLEQLKEMLTQLKIMKDAGTIPPEELATVRQQFKEAFGSGIDEIVSQAATDKDAMSSADLELLDLMKEILEN